MEHRDHLEKLKSTFTKILNAHEGELKDRFVLTAGRETMIHMGTQVVIVLHIITIQYRPQSLRSSETTKSVDHIVPYRIHFKSE